MSRSRTDLEYEIRPYRREDEPRVLDLLHDALGPGPVGERTPPFFRWKHEDNPFGRSFMLVAEVDRRIAGLRAFMRWRFRAGEVQLRAVTAVDTATHPDFQGHGIFSGLTRAALEALEGEVDLVFNTPNEKSLPGYLKMGWQVVGRVPVAVRVRRPVHFAANARSLKSPALPASDAPVADAPSAADALSAGGVEALLARGRDRRARIETARDLEYLRWRYASVPGLEYRAVRIGPPGRTDGLGVFRIRARGGLREASVVETLTAADDVRSARRVLRAVAAAVRVDHVVCHFPAGAAAARASLRSGYVRPPYGVTFVVKPLRGDLHPDPTVLGSWALSLGDLELF